MANFSSDLLPPREQLELFANSGQGARVSMAKSKTKAAGGGGGGTPAAPGGMGGTPGDHDTSLEEEARRRYLNYALSVITSRALPDARDGLKPVQRRILYGMYAEGMRPDRPHRKCANAVGEVMGKYHPHGDQSIYDALARMAQDFSLRYPLIDGHGNFGSPNDRPAAAR